MRASRDAGNSHTLEGEVPAPEGYLLLCASNRPDRNQHGDWRRITQRSCGHAMASCPTRRENSDATVRGARRKQR